MRGRTSLLHAAGAIALMMGATPAFAQDDTTSQLLLRLKEKGILTDEEYNQLVARKATEPAAVATNAPTEPQQAAAQALDDKHLVRMADSGVGMQVGGVTVKFSGSINGFYTHEAGDKSTAGTAVAGGLAGVGKNSSSVRNGLLPGFLKVDVTTNQGGWDVGAHFGLYPGINSVSNVGGANSAGTPQALATSGIDFRQTYLTFGRPNIGEIKIGRDIGLFGSDAILNDITLLSVGSTGGNVAPSNTSLGRIGIGYIYTDFQPQITYTTPKFGGFQASVGIFQPLVTIGNNEVNGTPGFQGKVTYDFTADKFGGHLWASGITQKHDGVGGFPSYTGSGFDVGAKLTYGPFSALGYYYDGSGIGTTGLFILSTDALGRKRDSNGFYGQATATFGKFTLGGSYGESHLDLTNGEINPTLLDKNSSWVGQGRYGLTSWVTLVGEYVHTKAEAHGTNEATSDTIALGAILFF
ncbi:MAG: porin [Sphingomonas sp.]|uniref:porin n=1 Tax=Sphingomonas sp. TaxID=28214 RepID=UPI003561B021